MDDYKWIVRTEEFLANPFSSYLEFSKIHDKQGNSSTIYSFTILNSVCTWDLHNSLFTYRKYFYFNIYSFFLYKVFGQTSYKLFIFFSNFLIFPYTYDLFLLPSLQEKFSIPLFSYLIYKLEKNRDSSTNSTLDIFLISFSIPLIKLQGSVLSCLYFFTTCYIKLNHLNFQFLGFAFSISLQAYLLFFTNSGYYVLEKI